MKINPAKNRNDIFALTSDYVARGDQQSAINHLTSAIQRGTKEQVLLGVTGSGKTFTMANVIANLGRSTLIISHNKTLAAQLYQEFRDFFPNNAVSYFVSYYDYYQPEAYIPGSDTYIEKETEINEEIDKLRLGATTNLLTRPDTIIVASVSCIYNIGSPKEYGHFVLELAPGMNVTREQILTRLVQLQYERNDFGFVRGTFRVRGDSIDLYPAYEDTVLRLVITLDKLVQLVKLDPLTGKTIEKLTSAFIYPSKHYMTDPNRHTQVFKEIQKDLDDQIRFFTNKGKLVEAQRIRERVNFDLEMIAEMGYVNGIENYSRYFDGRNPGDPPYTLFDYFDEAVNSRPGLERDWLLFIDESHMTIPQVRGMYNGDRSRKQTLIDYGFRLPASIDNRPLRFDEFLRRIPQTVYVSATPDEWELNRTPEIVEQLVRPTGLVDPTIAIRPSLGQIDDLIKEIEKRVAIKQRVMVTTLTKRMAEDLASYLEERSIKAKYLHSDIETLKRTDVLAELRLGTFDVIVGINLLREGLDLPEVSLVAILDADKEGFLRSKTSLIQTMGRAARHIAGSVILYADSVTKSMAGAIKEVDRRRSIQLSYNQKYNISPQSISKPIRNKLVADKYGSIKISEISEFTQEVLERMTPEDKKKRVSELTKIMKQASRDLDFEQAIAIRDLITRIQAG